MRENTIPGVSIGIIQDGKIVYTKGYGYRDLENSLPMTPDTLFGIGSITKSFTAFAIMKLVEDQKIHLDDSVSIHLQKEPFLSNPDITIGHILSHSSGLPSTDASMIETWYKYGKFDKIYPIASEDDFFDHIAAVKSFIVHKPGEIMLYNNDLYECLGLIIEKISKKPYSQYIQDLLLSQLGMTRATFSKDAILQDSMSNYVTPYLKVEGDKKDTLKEIEFPHHWLFTASGGLFASINDMLKYIQFMLNTGSIGERQVISSDNFSTLWKPRISDPDGFTPNAKYALGWALDEKYMDHTVIYHGGHIDFNCASVIMVPNKNIGVIVGQNSCNSSASIIGRYILALLLDKLPEKVIPELKFKNLLKLLIGTYISPLGLYKLEIALKDQILWAVIEYDDGIIHAPLIMDDENGLSFSLCLAQHPPYSKIKFITNTTNDLVEFVHYDRYIYKKK